jgi:uncharacterized protein DUF2336
MSARPSLIPELDAMIERGSPEQRTRTLERLTAFFLEGASQFNADHVELFDSVFSRLIVELETMARRQLSQRLAPLANAPLDVVRCLARDDDSAVAAPLLTRSPRLAQSDLMDIAETKSQAHLVAIAARPGIAAPVIDVLLRRGNRDVARRLVENRAARLSDDAHAAQSDLATASREPLSETSKTGDIVGALAPSRDYLAARRLIVALEREGRLGEGAVVAFARNGQYVETVAALAALGAVPIEVVDRLMGVERPDPILILCKSAGWGWPTAAAVISVRPARRRRSEGLDAIAAKFERLSPMTARRVVRFWQARRQGGDLPMDSEPVR